MIDYFSQFEPEQLAILRDCEYYLLDLSGGRGLEYDPNRLFCIESTLRDVFNFQHIFGVAGGIGPENVAATLGQFPAHAIDAESNLRTNNRLDVEKVRNYLEGAAWQANSFGRPGVDGEKVE